MAIGTEKEKQMLMVSSAFLQVGRTEFAHRHRAASSQGDASVKLLTRNEGRGMEVLRMKTKKGKFRVSVERAAYFGSATYCSSPAGFFPRFHFIKGKLSPSSAARNREEPETGG